ncbi:MAG: hypothetical protein M3R06_04970 [Chloroflexota bacterium]|nr:hypothetical protein [Chloroflexota bacterium]
MLFSAELVSPESFETTTGWQIKAEGACRDDRCVPLPPTAWKADGSLALGVLAERLGMPLIHDEAQMLWALGPEAGGRVLTSARLPPIVLPDLDGQLCDLAMLRGQKVLLLAWASW